MGGWHRPDAYAPANLPADPGWSFLVGAENPLGHGEMTSLLPTQDLRVTTSGFEAGGTTSYSFSVEGFQRGIGAVSTEMQVAGLSGTVVATTPIEVLKKP